MAELDEAAMNLDNVQAFLVDDVDQGAHEIEDQNVRAWRDDLAAAAWRQLTGADYVP